jgi:DNA-directed RNA polymerase specialized sigma24 family protein
VPPAPGETQLDPDAALRAQLYAHVVRYCPSWLRGEADDIAQKAWLRLQSDAAGAAPAGPALVARVAYCATVDEIRRRRRRREVPLEERPAVRADGDPARSAGARELRRSIEDCLARMLHDRRLAVTLRLLGHTVTDCARLLEWPAKRAENMVLRGLSDLRRCLAAKGIAP